MGMSYAIRRVAIAVGESLSSPVFLGSKKIVSIQMPAAWDSADLTFQTSPDGEIYTDVAVGGSEYVEPASASVSISASPSAIQSAYCKIRSGTSAVPVAQSASRELVVSLRS